MKIIYLHQYFNTPEMSGGTRSYEMARRMVDAGHEVDIVTSWRSDGEKETGWFVTDESGIKVHWLPVPYSNHMSYRARIIVFLRFAILSTIKACRLKGDVIFATSTPLTIAIPAVFAARCKNIPMIFEVRDLWPELPIAMGALKNPVARWLAKVLERFAYRNACRVVALSPGMKEGVVAEGYPEHKVAVIPNSADLDMFYPEVEGARDFRMGLGLPEGYALIVYTGTFGAINGVSYFVEMAKAAMDKELPLYFLAVGDGAERERIEALAYQLGVMGKTFSTMAPVAKMRVPQILAAADVACSLFIDLKPMWANSANKFFDGLASGTPMAINYGGWQSELLSSTGAGLILPIGNPAKGAEILAEFVKDKDRHEAAGRAARQLAETKFSRDRLAAKLERVIIEAAHER